MAGGCAALLREVDQAPSGAEAGDADSAPGERDEVESWASQSDGDSWAGQEASEPWEQGDNAEGESWPAPEPEAVDGDGASSLLSPGEHDTDPADGPMNGGEPSGRAAAPRPSGEGKPIPLRAGAKAPERGNGSPPFAPQHGFVLDMTRDDEDDEFERF